MDTLALFNAYELPTMASANGHRQWVLGGVRPFLGTMVLDVGAGIGNYASFLVDRHHPCLLDESSECCRYLKGEFGSYENVCVVLGDICDPRVPDILGTTFDTILCLDVLEHIKDDARALLLARFVDEESYEELSKRLGCSNDAVRRRVSDALKRAREVLKALDFE